MRLYQIILALPDDITSDDVQIHVPASEGEAYVCSEGYIGPTFSELPRAEAADDVIDAEATEVVDEESSETASEESSDTNSEESE